MKLSIIIPAYNAEPFLDVLVRRLFPQLTKEVEVIIVDDGSNFPYIAPVKGFKVIRKPNGGVSSARNLGLSKAKGEWVAFIDADDLVAEDYVETVLKTLEDDPDFVYLSWKTFGRGWDYEVILKSVEDKFPEFNLCVWNRIYRRSMIGEVRFNEKKAIAEDAQFIREVREEGRKKAFIGRPIYFYRTDPRNGLTERFNRGELDMERIVYYLPEIKNPKKLIEEIREESEEAEVIVMTYEDPKILEGACMVIKPRPIRGTQLRGQETNLFEFIPKPIKAQVMIYQGRIHAIGGVETWMYNFCVEFKDEYDVMVVYREDSDVKQIKRLRELVPVLRLSKDEPLVCNVFLNMRITDRIPDNVRAGQVIQLCHLCQMKENYKIQPRHDLVVFPSEAAKKSFANQTDGEVIPNITLGGERSKSLLFVTASRFTYEKGEERMRNLAKSLTDAGVNFVWMVFTDARIEPFPGMIRMEPRFDVSQFIMAADYLVQLSDKESFCYSIVEALEAGTPVLTTNIEVLKEIGFQDGENGYLIPWDGNVNPFLAHMIRDEIPKFEYSRRIANIQSLKRWREIIGPMEKQWKSLDGEATVEIIRPYYDTVMKRMTKVGELLTMEPKRAEQILFAGFAKVAPCAKVAKNAKINVIQ